MGFYREPEMPAGTAAVEGPMSGLEPGWIYLNPPFALGGQGPGRCPELDEG